jgi:hypothetical protein
MKLLLGTFLVSTFCILAACGSETSANNSLARIQEAKKAPLIRAEVKKSFEDCLISEKLKNSRMSFVAIKNSCHASELAKCKGAKACESDFKTVTEEVMSRATGVDCDSGYCTILY